MTEVKKLEYKDFKGLLKKAFDDFMEHPENYGVTDKEQIEEIKDTSVFMKWTMWKLFKEKAKLKIEEMDKIDVASAFIADLKEDNVSITTEKLKDILKDPGNPDYKLEKDMIDYLKKLDSDDVKDLKSKVSEIEGLKVDKEEENIGHKILGTLKNIWEKIAPAVDTVLDVLLSVGASALKGLLDQKIKNKDINDSIDILIDDTKKSLQDVEIENLTISGNNDDVMEQNA